MYLLKNGFIVDPENSLFYKGNIVIGDSGEIVSISENEPTGNFDKVYDLDGKTVFPGFIDMHVHLREPGREDKETILSGLTAAAAGGFTGVAPMPNTTPICDNKVVVEYCQKKAQEAGMSKLYAIGAVTKGEKGEELAAIGDMYKSGIVAVSDDGRPVMNSLLARRAFEYIKHYDIPLICHAEDEFLAKGGVMNEGEYSLKLGMKGIPNAAEAIIVGRDILLAEMTDSRLHIAHASTEEALRLVKDAKARGLKVTVEVAPHHFTLTDEEVQTQNYSTDTKVNPPLRSRKDVDKMVEYIREGIVDIIATDHAPHTLVDKSVEYDYAPFGMVGLETAVGLVVTKLLKAGVIDLNRMAELMSVNPRKIFKIDGGLKAGKKADISIVDMNAEWTVDRTKFYSKSKNTPFDGMKLTGKPYMTIVDGKVVMEKGEIVKG